MMSYSERSFENETLATFYDGGITRQAICGHRSMVHPEHFSHDGNCHSTDVVAICSRCNVPLCKKCVKEFRYVHGYLCLTCKMEEKALTENLRERSF